jgi:hypothetical protein
MKETKYLNDRAKKYLYAPAGIELTTEIKVSQEDNKEEEE